MSLSEYILNQLKEDEININDSRSQFYDNAAVMAGHISGVHQRISQKNNLAVFVNCDNHSLNLVGVHSAKEEVVMVTFFDTIKLCIRSFQDQQSGGINQKRQC